MGMEVRRMPTVLQQADIAWESEVLEEAEAIVQAEWLRVVWARHHAHHEAAEGLADRTCRTSLYRNVFGAHPEARGAPGTTMGPFGGAPKSKVWATQRSPPSAWRDH
jgi:hypothetical protein